MYGIAGILRQPHNRLPDLAARLAAMTAAVAHQEPDDEEIYVTLPGGQIAITYNGAIDNTAALRRELETLGGTFHFHSDTEVILPSDALWGKTSVPQLRGMVAFVLLDQYHRSAQAGRFDHRQCHGCK